MYKRRTKKILKRRRRYPIKRKLFKTYKKPRVKPDGMYKEKVTKEFDVWPANGDSAWFRVMWNVQDPPQ